MLNLSQDIQSLSTFKRKTNEFIQQMKHTGNPVVLTINGKAELVVQDAAAYQTLLETVERLETLLGIKRGLEDIKAGNTELLGDFIEEMQGKHEISS